MKNDYFGKGLLRKGKKNEEEILGSIELAERFLERSKGNLKIEYFDIAFTLSYNSMFHSARALLFSLGIKERSHLAMVGFLKENFMRIKNFYIF